MTLPVQLDLPKVTSFDISAINCFSQLIVDAFECPDTNVRVVPNSRILVKEMRLAESLKWARFYYRLNRITPDKPIKLADGSEHTGPYYHVEGLAFRITDQ